MSAKTSVLSPHDKVFRAGMGNINVAREYFLMNLPKEILALTDLSTLKLCPQTYVDEELKLSQSDVLYSVQIPREKAYLYLLCEHVRHEVTQIKVHRNMLGLIRNLTDEEHSSYKV